MLDPDGERVAPAADDVTLISGPEGGLAWLETEQLAAAGFRGMSLGPNTLRAETAPLVAVAVIRATVLPVRP